MSTNVCKIVPAIAMSNVPVFPFPLSSSRSPSVFELLLELVILPLLDPLLLLGLLLEPLLEPLLYDPH